MADEDDELQTIQKQIANRKQELSTRLPEHDTDVMEVVKKEESELLKSDEVKRISKKFAEERTKSDLSAEASRIRQKNIETAENEFKNETKELKLTHLKAEMKLQHKYNMSTLEADARHKQMLSRRKKLVEKYGYLYNSNPEDCITCYDDNGEAYSVPKDFSYSPTVNKVRQFGRNLSKLDRPILQTLKWVLIIGAGIGLYFIIKSMGIF